MHLSRKIHSHKIGIKRTAYTRLGLRRGLSLLVEYDQDPGVSVVDEFWEQLNELWNSENLTSESMTKLLTLHGCRGLGCIGLLDDGVFIVQKGKTSVYVLHGQTEVRKYEAELTTLELKPDVVDRVLILDQGAKALFDATRRELRTPEDSDHYTAIVAQLSR